MGKVFHGGFESLNHHSLTEALEVNDYVSSSAVENYEKILERFLLFDSAQGDKLEVTAHIL